MDDERLTDELLQLKRSVLRGRHYADKVFYVKDADNVIDRILVDRNSRELLFPGNAHNFVIFRIDGERDDLLSMCHDLRHFLVVELKDVLDHFLLGIFDISGLGTDINHHADLFLSNGLVCLIGIDPEHS